MDEIAAAVSNTVFSFNAPLIWNFAEYIVKEAHRRGLRRVYFLARDGYEPYIFANRIADELGYALECRYLYASRLAWRLPAYALLPSFRAKQALLFPRSEHRSAAYRCRKKRCSRRRREVCPREKAPFSKE